MFRSDCTVAFLWPEGGSFAYHVDDEGQEVVRINYGVWQPLGDAEFTDWQQEVLALVLDAAVSFSSRRWLERGLAQ